MRSRAKTLAAICALAVVISVVVLVFKYQTKAWIITGVAVLPVAWSVAAAIFLWWRRGQQGNPSAATTLAQSTAAADWLAAETAARWKQEAAGRRITTPAPARVRWHWAPESVSVSAAEAVTPLPQGTGPAPLPGIGLPAVILSSGLVTRLHDEVYARLPSGRLVLTGGPGAGKTGAMILLLLAALDWRGRQSEDTRSLVPVPVWLTLGGWNPAAESLIDWVVGVLNRDYPALRAADYGADASAALLRAGRIALFLDGFDELPLGLRAAAVRRLNTEAGELRVVLTSRPAEYEFALRDVNLDNCAVIELRPIRAAEAAAYLMRGQAGPSRARWQPVATYLETDPGSLVARALDSPLTLSMAREAYAVRDPGVLTDPHRFSTTDAVTTHLVDQFLVTAYKDERERAYAVRWLAWIAANMGTGRELRWWEIARWVPGWRLRLARALITALLAGSSATLLAWLWYRDLVTLTSQPGVAAWAAPGIAIGLGTAMLTGLFFRLEDGPVAARTGIVERLKAVFKASPVWVSAALMASVLAPAVAQVLLPAGSPLLGSVNFVLFVVLTVLTVEIWKAIRHRPRPSQIVRKLLGTSGRRSNGREPRLETPTARVVSGVLAVGVPLTIWYGMADGPQDALPDGFSWVIYAVPLCWILGRLWRGAGGGQLGTPWALAPRWPRPKWLVPLGLLAFPLVIPRWVGGWVTPAADTPSATAISTYRGDRRASAIYAWGYAAMPVVPVILVILGASLNLGPTSSAGVAADTERTALALGWVVVMTACIWCTAWLCSGQVPLANLAQLVLWPTHGRVSFARLLDDAHRRQVLRQAGTVYQFRHAALQSRLACRATADDTGAQATEIEHPDSATPASDAAWHQKQ
jgi:hypothetical protein